MNSLRATKIPLDSHQLIVVESIDTQTCGTGDDCFVYGSLAPIAIVTCGPQGTSALDMHANAISLTDLMIAVPQLNELISEPTGS